MIEKRKQEEKRRESIVCYENNKRLYGGKQKLKLINQILLEIAYEVENSNHEVENFK